MTTVAGNVSVEKTTRNALQLLHFSNADIPLAQGAAAPLVRPLRDAASVHGESGMKRAVVLLNVTVSRSANRRFQAIRDALMLARNRYAGELWVRLTDYCAAALTNTLNVSALTSAVW
ncbi:nucleoside hydrolase [Shigella flexneri]